MSEYRDIFTLANGWRGTDALFEVEGYELHFFEGVVEETKDTYGLMAFGRVADGRRFYIRTKLSRQLCTLEPKVARELVSEDLERQRRLLEGRSVAHGEEASE